MKLINDKLKQVKRFIFNSNPSISKRPLPVCPYHFKNVIIRSFSMPGHYEDYYICRACLIREECFSCQYFEDNLIARIDSICNRRKEKNEKILEKY